MLKTKNGSTKLKLDKEDSVEAFLALRKITPRRTTKQILVAIRKGRM